MTADTGCTIGTPGYRSVDRVLELWLALNADGDWEHQHGVDLRLVGGRWLLKFDFAETVFEVVPTLCRDSFAECVDDSGESVTVRVDARAIRFDTTPGALAWGLYLFSEIALGQEVVGRAPFSIQELAATAATVRASEQRVENGGLIRSLEELSRRLVKPAAEAPKVILQSTDNPGWSLQVEVDSSQSTFNERPRDWQSVHSFSKFDWLDVRSSPFSFESTSGALNLRDMASSLDVWQIHLGQ